MKHVHLLIKDDCDDYEGCITEVIGVFTLQRTARKHRKKNVRLSIEEAGDKLEKVDKQDNIIRVNTLRGATSYIIEKKQVK